VRRWASVVVAFVTFCVALAGFLWIGVAAQNNDVRVLVTSRNIAAGEVLSANTSDLAKGGALVHLTGGAQQDTIPEADYRDVQGAVALVTIPAGALILRHDLAFGIGSSLRQLSLNLAFMPTGVTRGDRVDLFAVSGTQAGSVTPGADLCGDTASVGCVVPLAQSVTVIAANQPSHLLTIAVSPAEVAPWLLLDATEPIWAVPAGAVSCEGTEQAISDPYQALIAIRDGTAAKACADAVPAAGPG
jgi:hypothetical protein